MAVSRNSGHRPNGTFLETFTGRLSRYDILLAAIPAVLGVALLIGWVSPVPFHLAVLAGALVGALLVGDAVYIHPPTRTPPEQPYSRND